MHHNMMMNYASVPDIDQCDLCRWHACGLTCREFLATLQHHWKIQSHKWICKTAKKKYRYINHKVRLYYMHNNFGEVVEEREIQACCVVNSWLSTASVIQNDSFLTGVIQLIAVWQSWLASVDTGKGIIVKFATCNLAKHGFSPMEPIFPLLCREAWVIFITSDVTLWDENYPLTYPHRKNLLSHEIITQVHEWQKTVDNWVDWQNSPWEKVSQGSLGVVMETHAMHSSIRQLHERCNKAPSHS